MKPFDYHRATSPADAVAMLTKHQHAAYLAGGTNLVDHMKLGVAQPDLLVDVSGLDDGFYPFKRFLIRNRIIDTVAVSFSLNYSGQFEF